jgi:arylsulfatase A-like enzyme
MIRIARVAALAAVCGLFCIGRAVGAQSKPPNILIIVADDMGYGDIGPYGGTDIPTPNLDALASGGIRFTDAYVSGTVCGPTRAGLMTGRYQQRFGQEHNIGIVPEHRDVGLPLEEVTIATRLKAAGYRTAMVGKWHLGFAPRFRPMARGFEEFFGFLAGAHSYVNPMPERNPLYDGDTVVREAPYLTDAFAERAAAFIDRQRGSAQPFFLYLAFNAVHVPNQATERYLARFANITDPQRRTYAAMLSAMDDAIGRVLTALRAANLEEQTVIFFFSDNGGPTTVGGVNGSRNGPLRGSKSQTWEGGIRVPFIIQWKGHLPAGVTDTRPIIQLDVHPTALAAAGIAIDPAWKLDGVNLLPYLTGQVNAPPHDALFWRFGARMAVRQGDWKLVLTPDRPMAADTLPLTDLSAAELYNLKDDIGESHNLAATNTAKAQELAAVWQRWNAELIPPRWRPPAGGPGPEGPRP